MAGVFAGICLADLLEEVGPPWALWAVLAALFVLAVGVGWRQGELGDAWRRLLSGFASNGPRAGNGKRFQRWLGSVGFVVLVLLCLVVAKAVVVGATMDVLSMLKAT